jgi:hypothetical protein
MSQQQHAIVQQICMPVLVQLQQSVLNCFTCPHAAPPPSYLAYLAAPPTFDHPAGLC